MSQMNQKIDYLKEDKEIAGQSIALVSMVEPTNSRMLMNREAFFATRFLKGFIEEYKQALVYTTLNPEAEVSDIVKSRLDISYENIKQHYYDFQKTSLDKLETEFTKEQNPNQEPTITGFKVRGVFPNQLVAKAKAQELQATEQWSDIFAIPVGKWCPYLPMNMEAIKPEYQEPALNELVREKIKEVEKAKLKFDEDKRVSMAKIAAEEELRKEKNRLALEEEQKVSVEEVNDEDLQATKPTKSNRRRNRRKNNRRKRN